MSVLEGTQTSVASANDRDWSGKADELLQEQLKKVQKECRQLREAYRRDGSSSRLSQNSRANSTHSLLLGSTKMTTHPADVSPPSLSALNLTPHTHTTSTTHHLPPSHSASSLNAHLSASFSSVKSTMSELAPPTMTSSRHHQEHSSFTPRCTAGQVSSTPRNRHSAVNKTTRKKVAVHRSAKKGSSHGQSSSGTVTTNAWYKPRPPLSSGRGGKQQAEPVKVGSGQLTTPVHVLDSGYSSGSGTRPRASVSGDQLPAGFITSGGGSEAMVSSAASPSLHYTTCVPVSATLHLTGRRAEGDGEKVEESGRVRQLEHEVAVLEQQLSEKTAAARSHVEEVTCMRSELARERASLTRERQESQEAAMAELRREKASHAEQQRSLTEQLERLQGKKREGDREVGTLRASLRASEAEVTRLSEVVSRLTQQLEREREGHASTARSLHTAAEEGRTKVAELEQSLRACNDEVSGHMTRLGEMERSYLTQIDTLRNKVTSLEAALAVTDTQLEEKAAEVVNLQTKLASVQAQHERQLQDKMDTVSHLQDDLNRLRAQKEQEKEGWRRRERDLEQSLGRSEQVRQSLLAQVERNGEELEKLTERLAMVQGREAETERCRAEAEQLKQIVSGLQRGRQEQEAEDKEGREERRRLQMQLGHLQAQLQSATSQLQQSREREAEYSRATAELIKEAGQVRAESGRVKGQLETCQRDLEEARSRLREKEESAESSVGSMSQELAARAQQVLEMEKLLQTQQTESTSRRLELERNLARCQSDLRTRTQQLEQLTAQLSQSQKTTDQLQVKVTQLQTAEQAHSSDVEKQLSSKDTELAVLHNRLQSLQESHSAVLVSSEQMVSTHRKAETQVAEQLRMRQEELSRTRAQVSSLSIELTGERKISEELRNQVTLARAEAARYQAQVSSMQRAVSVGSFGVAAGLHKYHSLPPSSTSGATATPASKAPSPSTSNQPASSSSGADQKKGKVIDL